MIEKTPSARDCCSSAPRPAIHVSFDDGAAWQPLRLELPVTPVHGILVKNDDLVIGTHGRSFYVMDNISVLRQIARETTNDAVVLFDPADATRSVSRGVAVDYFLKRPADSVTIEFLDPQGASDPDVHRYASPAPDAAAARPAAEEGDEDNPRAPVAPRAGVAQGMNRFAWDMRYAGARDFPGLIMWAGSARGPEAPPGRYTVKLTADGVTKTQDFQIRRNEAVQTVTDADLNAQFALASQISDKVSAANAAVLRIRSIKEQIADRLGKAADPEVTTAGEALAGQADGGRRGDLPVPQPQQPGSAELPDPVEQQAGRAAGHRRERRLPADRPGICGLQGALGAPVQVSRGPRSARGARDSRVQQDAVRKEAAADQGRRASADEVDRPT